MEILIMHENALYRWSVQDADYEDGIIHAERLDFHPGCGEWEESGEWAEFNPVEVLGLLTEKLSGVTEAVKAQQAEQKREFEGMYHHLTSKVRKQKEGAENA